MVSREVMRLQEENRKLHAECKQLAHDRWREQVGRTEAERELRKARSKTQDGNYRMLRIREIVHEWEQR